MDRTRSRWGDQSILLKPEIQEYLLLEGGGEAMLGIRGCVFQGEQHVMEKKFRQSNLDRLGPKKKS